MVKAYFWVLKLFWRGRRNFGGAGRKTPLLLFLLFSSTSRGPTLICHSVTKRETYYTTKILHIKLLKVVEELIVWMSTTRLFILA